MEACLQCQDKMGRLSKVAGRRKIDRRRGKIECGKGKGRKDSAGRTESH